MSKQIKELTEIDSYVGLQKELESYFSNVSNDYLKDIEQYTFALIGPDGLIPTNLDHIIDSLKSKGFKIVDYKFFNNISEEKIEDLYKYSVPDAVRTMPHFLDNQCDTKNHCPFMSSIPTRNWRILRKRFMLGPSLALILYHKSKQAAPYLKSIKGPTDPIKCKDNQIRNRTDNPVFSIVHSSDDSPSVLRESILFFGIKRFLNIIQRQSLSVVDFSEIKKYVSITKPDQNEYRFPLIACNLRLRLLIATDSTKTKLFDFYWNWREKLKEHRIGKVMLELYTQFLEEEVNMIQRESIDFTTKQMISELNNIITKNVSFESLVLKLKLNSVNIGLHEEVVLESGLWYYRDVKIGADTK